MRLRGKKGERAESCPYLARGSPVDCAPRNAHCASRWASGARGMLPMGSLSPMGKEESISSRKADTASGVSGMSAVRSGARRSRRWGTPRSSSRTCRSECSPVWPSPVQQARIAVCSERRRSEIRRSAEPEETRPSIMPANSSEPSRRLRSYSATSFSTSSVATAVTWCNIERSGISAALAAATRAAGREAGTRKAAAEPGLDDRRRIAGMGSLRRAISSVRARDSSSGTSRWSASRELPLCGSSTKKSHSSMLPSLSNRSALEEPPIASRTVS